jgi:hypothetical protein
MQMQSRQWVRGSVAAATTLVIGTLVLSARGGEEVAPVASADRFVVHEWGTFTSMQGADGVLLEGLVREEESLPHFVYDRAQIRDCPLRSEGWKGLEVPADHVTQKMETPVIYFHSTTPRRVRVRVDFVKGLITEWYPVSDLLGPPEGARDAAPLDVSKIERSFLEWDVDVLGTSAKRPREVPEVATDDPWQFAREVDASWLRTRPRSAPGRDGPVEAERYLFYRGLGHFPLPLRVTMDHDDVAVLWNESDVTLSPSVFYEIRGDRGRMVLTDEVAPGHAVKAVLRGGEHWGPVSDIERKLQAVVENRLEKTGLRKDEARAMVRTWSRSWFRSEGTRVLWFVPRETTDALLPLSIDPVPDEMVRVLVGRLELIPPSIAKEDYTALLDTAGDDAAIGRGMKVLDRRGRFLEPHLRNVMAAIQQRALDGAALGTDATVLDRAVVLLEGLRTDGATIPTGR